ncbi:MAG: WD40 repeat domain-containing protein [Armatimonadota bacterium]
MMLTLDPDDFARLRDSETGAEVERWKWPIGRFDSSMTVSADGKWIAIARESLSEIKIWRTARPEPVARCVLPASVIGFSPDSRLLAARTGRWGSASIHLLNPTTGRRVHTLTAEAFAFSPTGTEAAAVARDGVLTLWRTDDWQVLRRIANGSMSASSLAFSAEGELLAAGSDGAVEVFDVSTGRELARLPFPSLALELSFSPDSSMLLVKTDREVHVWRIPPRAQLNLRAALLGPF